MQLSALQAEAAVGGLIEQAAKQAERVAADLAAVTARELAKAAAPVVKAAAPVVKAAVPAIKSVAAPQVGSGAGWPALQADRLGT